MTQPKARGRNGVGKSIRPSGLGTAANLAWGKALGLALRRHRKALGLTQRALGQMAGCGPVFVYDLERGKPSLRLSKVVDVLLVLGMQLTLELGKDGLSVPKALR